MHTGRLLPSPFPPSFPAAYSTTKSWRSHSHLSVWCISSLFPPMLAPHELLCMRAPTAYARGKSPVARSRGISSQSASGKPMSKNARRAS